MAEVTDETAQGDQSQWPSITSWGNCSSSSLDIFRGDLGEQIISNQCMLQQLSRTGGEENGPVLFSANVGTWTSITNIRTRKIL